MKAQKKRRQSLIALSVLVSPPSLTPVQRYRARLLPHLACVLLLQAHSRCYTVRRNLVPPHAPLDSTRTTWLIHLSRLLCHYYLCAPSWSRDDGRSLDRWVGDRSQLMRLRFCCLILSTHSRPRSFRFQCRALRGSGSLGTRWHVLLKVNYSQSISDGQLCI